MPAIKSHKTAVDLKSKWDGPKAVADAPNDSKILNYMHAWEAADGDLTKKSAYKFPHHEPKMDAAANIAGVNNALARLADAKIPDGDRVGVETHLRRHRKDAGLKESMSEAEIADAVKYIKRADDLKSAEASNVMEGLRRQEMKARKYSGAIMKRAKLIEYMLQEAMSPEQAEICCQKEMGDISQGAYVLQQLSMLQNEADEPDDISEIADLMRGVCNWIMGEIDEMEAAGKQSAGGDDEGTGSDEPAMATMSPAMAMESRGSVELIESAAGGMFMPLMEKSVRSDGTVPVKVIQPGWGSSGFYSAEVLKRDGPKVFPKGTKMYWNHPTPSQEAERPERDLNDLAGVTVNDARWLDNGPAGPGLYTDAQVFESYKSAVDDMAKHIGVSIRAMGQAENGSADGRQGPIITALTQGRSIDYVTEAGAGGEILGLFEAARSSSAARAAEVADKKTTSTSVATFTEEAMAEYKNLEEANAALKNDLARAQEALALREAKDIVGASLAKINVPDATKTRLIESLSKSAPVKDGALDKDAFKAQIEEAVKAEVKYLVEAAGMGQIRGMGETVKGEEFNEAEAEETLMQAFADMGLNESTAKIAAKGRK
ncbi:MAG: hypothetical protein HYX49_08920 [Chloroflexi bacterium]|nr:hypothetical protein [Chloroflexota bacterium]